MHLANNSIQKKSKKFKNLLIPGNMWHSDQFIDHITKVFVRHPLTPAPPGKRTHVSAADSLVHRSGPHGVALTRAGKCGPVVQEDPTADGEDCRVGAPVRTGHGTPRPRCPLVVYLITQCRVLTRLPIPCTQVMNRQNSCELYGYDFMIDASWRPWLIEINSSPDFSYSTKVTERLVKACAPDVVKVLVDLPYVDLCGAMRVVGAGAVGAVLRSVTLDSLPAAQAMGKGEAAAPSAAQAKQEEEEGGRGSGGGRRQRCGGTA